MTEINEIEKTYRRLRTEGRDILRLFSGNPNDAGIFFPGKILEDIYSRYFQQQHYHPHPKGLPEARRAIANYYASQDAVVDPEHIIVTSGTSESFLNIFTLLTKPGDNILTSRPSYPLFDHIAELARIELKPYRLDEGKNWAIDLPNLRRQTDDRTKAIVLISPHNPTGAVATPEEIREMVDWANQKNIAIICDEVFSEFYFGEGVYPRMMIAKPKLGFTLNGISKMFALPALKLGWIAVTGDKILVEDAVDRLETTNDTFLSCHTPIQLALPELFEKGAEFLAHYRAVVRQRRDLAVSLIENMTGVDWVAPRGGFYLMARVTPPLLQQEEAFVIRLMKEKGVFVHPGHFYEHNCGTHWVACYLAPPEQMRQGLRAIGELLSAVP